MCVGRRESEDHNSEGVLTVKREMKKKSNCIVTPTSEEGGDSLHRVCVCWLGGICFFFPQNGTTGHVKYLVLFMG